MIRYKSTLTDSKFYLFSVKLYGMQNQHITDREAQLASELLACSIYPFKGRGRRIISRELMLSSSNFSIILKGLVDKGVIIKSDIDNDYDFNPYFKYIKEKWTNDEIDNIEIVFDLKKKQNEN